MPLLDRTTTVARSDGIDLVRFALALYVIVSHLAEWEPHAPTLEAFGRVTVELFQSHGETNPAVVAFIVLSGYCIHRNGCRRTRWNTQSYVVKRAFRIVPVYLLACLVGAGLFAVSLRASPALAVRTTATSQITLAGLAAKLTAIAALLPLPHVYAASYQANAPLATVAAEIWLYAVYALAMGLLLRGAVGERGLWAAIVAITAVSLVVVSAVPSLQAWWFNGSVVGFLPLWWIGAEIVGTHSRRSVVWLAAGAGGLWLLTTLYLFGTADLALEELRLLAFGVLVGVAIRLVDQFAHSLPRLTARFGRSGYSLYAFHTPILVALIALGAPLLVVVAAAIAGGVLMFWTYEQPLTLHGRRLARDLGRNDRRIVSTGLARGAIVDPPRPPSTMSPAIPAE